MPETDDHGIPLLDGTTSFPGFRTAYNAQSNALDAAITAAAQAEKDNDAVATVAALPTTGNWPGRIIMVEENDMLYIHDGAGWWIYGGKKPFYFGTRADSAVGTGGSPQEWITTTTSARGITMSSGVLTFSTPGIYRIDSSVIWEANGNGQRNLGVDGTGITVLGLAESVLFPNAFVEASQAYTSYIQVTAPGDTARPYVTHNTGLALDVYGGVSVMWESA